MTTTDTATSPVDASRGGNGLGGRVKHSLVLAQKRWVGLPDQLRVAVDGLWARMRDRLEIPSRAELATLAERLEDIDRKLAAFEASRESAANGPIPSGAGAEAGAKAKRSKAKPALADDVKAMLAEPASDAPLAESDEIASASDEPRRGGASVAKTAAAAAGAGKKPHGKKPGAKKTPKPS